MSIFPLDSVRNATIDRHIELHLEDLREEIAGFPFSLNDELDLQDVLEVYDLARPRLNVLASSLSDLRGAHGADIGTGFGFLPVLLIRGGLQTIATETDLTPAQFAAAHGIDLRPFRIGRMAPPIEPESLDFLVLAEVLEHLKMPPQAVLHDLIPLLRPAGRFILTTPNIARMEHVQALVAGENFLEPFPEGLPTGSDPTDFIEHVREYSVQEVVDAVEASGLAVQRVLMTGWGGAGYHPLPNPFVNEIIVLIATK
jgi:2-polyprenyl-3-methyl-5-hydroxy-6-metoxy-1,4-benzoquinol methylase